MSKAKRSKEEQIAGSIRNILRVLNYNLKDPDLIETPERVAKTWINEMLRKEATPNLFKAFPSKDHKQMITLHGHEAWTRCPHHLERVRMLITVAYIPGDAKLILGLSKMARMADYLAEGLMLQEEFADRLADALFTTTKASGCGIYVRGWHNCMQARGIKTSGDITTTALRGSFLEDPSIKSEFTQYCLRRYEV